MRRTGSVAKPMRLTVDVTLSKITHCNLAYECLQMDEHHHLRTDHTNTGHTNLHSITQRAITYIPSHNVPYNLLERLKYRELPGSHSSVQGTRSPDSSACMDPLAPTHRERHFSSPRNLLVGHQAQHHIQELPSSSTPKARYSCTTK